MTTALDDAREATRPDARPAEGERPDPATRDAALAKALATELTVDETKVTSALTEIREARQADRKADFSGVLDQAVTDGKLTRTEADAVLKAADAGVIPYGRGGHR